MTEANQAAAKSAPAATSLFELPVMQLPNFDLPNAEVPEAFRQIAENGVAQAKDAYEKLKATAEEATMQLEGVCATGRKGVKEYNRRVIETGRSNVNAAFDHAIALSRAKSLSEAFALSAAHVSDQLQAALGQAEELLALARKAASETVEPIKASVTKAHKKAA